jgi:hypothetical protein
MKASRNFVVAVSLVAALIASPASAGWDDPIDSIPDGSAVGLEELVLAAQWGVQIAQVAL